MIVIGSVCVGFDCTAGETFIADALRLKENNLRIKFEDESVLPGEPSNDWQITANDSASGGLNYFAIRDIDAAQDVFRLCAIASPTCTAIVPTGGAADVATATDNERRIGAVEARVGALDSRTTRLDERTETNREGVAIAIALSGGVALHPDHTAALGIAYGTFDGADAIGVSGGVRLSIRTVLSGAIGMGLETSAVGARLALKGTW